MRRLPAIVSSLLVGASALVVPVDAMARTAEPVTSDWTATLAAPVTAVATVVNTIHTSRWTPASPDPTGLTYNWLTGELIETDAEVEETTGAGWRNANVWRFSTSGVVHGTANTLTYTPVNKEPAALALDGASGPNARAWISMDSKQFIQQIRAGADGALFTPDDVSMGSFLTYPAGSQDPEGIAYGGGKLYVTDGLNKELWVFDPLDGDFLNGGSWSHWDTAALGQPDPEGVAYDARDGTLWILSNHKTSHLLHVTISGEPIELVDLSTVPRQMPGDFTLAPASDGSGTVHGYIAERGVDNGKDPAENDGRIVEITLTGSGPPPPGPGVNRLANGDFEAGASGLAPPSWKAVPGFVTDAGPNGIAHGGLGTGRFLGTELIATSFQQVSATAGASYTVDGWINIPTTTDAFTFTVKLQWRNATSAISTTTIKRFSASTAGWAQLPALSLVAPAGTTAVRVILTAANMSAATYVDDFSLTSL